jgi:transcriptional regulator with XRE-family HTH domain
MNRNNPQAMRRKVGLSQTEFWKRLGVGQSGGSRYENGYEFPLYLRLLMELAYGDEPLKVLKQIRRKRS